MRVYEAELVLQKVFYKEILYFCVNYSGSRSFCRIFYRRKPGAIPGTLAGRAVYWKKYYNTLLGKGEVKGFLKKVEKYADFI